jgi:hypothetical protein
MSTVTVLTTVSGREEARVLPGSTEGAQRVSHRRRVSRPLFVALLAAFVVMPATAPQAEAWTPQYTAPWYNVEVYYLKLVNCTRTGGWVRSDGSCAGYGSGRYSAYVRPLRLGSGLSSKVARPYAKLIARKNLCTHFADGDPGYRLRRAGYRNYTWGENIGCRSGYTNIYKAVLASHLNMQAEKSTGGGHWKNIKNSRYNYVGIGVWVYNGRTRVVSDFYRT